MAINKEKAEQWIKEGREITFSLVPKKAKIVDSKVTFQPIKNNDGEPFQNSWTLEDSLSREQKESGVYFATEKSKLTIYNGFTMDLANFKKATDFRWLIYTEEIVENPEESMSNKQAHFYIEMPEEQAKEELTVFRKKIKASQYVENSSDGVLKNIALLLGLNPNVSPSLLRKELLSMAMVDNKQLKGFKGYEKIINSFEDPRQKAKVMIYRGLEEGIFKKESGFVWFTPKTGEEIQRIGFNENEAAEWLLKESNGVFYREIVNALDPEFAIPFNKIEENDENKSKVKVGRPSSK